MYDINYTKKVLVYEVFEKEQSIKIAEERTMKLLKYIGEQFGKPTGLGGNISTFIMNIMNQKQYKAVLRKLKVEKNDTILDVGFGNGYLIGKLAKGSNARFWGIDISSDMLKVARRRNQKFIQNGKMNLGLGDISNTDFESDFFDRIYTVNTVYFWPNIDSALAEISRILKHGGIFINVIYSKEFLNSIPYASYGYSKYSKEELEEHSVRNGFKIIEIFTIKEKKVYCYVLQKNND